jgi:putative sterol carrier protein
MSDKYEFLSDGWIEAVKQITAESAAEVESAASAATGGIDLKLNQTVTDCPDSVGGGEKQLHMIISGGKVDWGLGHIDDADATIITDYETAKQIFVANDPQAGMQAFMAGKLRIEGDMTKLMALQQGGGPVGGGEVGKKIAEITA